MWKNVKQHGKVFRVGSDTKDKRKYVRDLSGGNIVHTRVEKSLEMSCTEQPNVQWANVQVRL